MVSATEAAVAEALRRQGARDRGTFERCEDLANRWEADARQSTGARTETLKACAAALVETISGPAGPAPEPVVVEQPRYAGMPQLRVLLVAGTVAGLVACALLWWTR